MVNARPVLARALVLGVVALALPGCFWVTTKREGAELRRDVDKLKGQLSVQDESIGEKVKRLDASLDKATKLLTRNSADLGADVQSMSQEVAKLTGQVNETLHQIESLQEELTRLKNTYQERQLELTQRLAELEKKAAEEKPPPPADKDALFATAEQKLKAKDYAEARRGFADFQKKFSQDQRADDALYFIGESYAAEKSYEKAIGSYQRLIDQYPNGDMADDAFYAAGEAAAAMKWCTDARAYYGVLIRRYPKSNFVKRAQRELKRLKKDAGNKSVCQS